MNIRPNPYLNLLKVNLPKNGVINIQSQNDYLDQAREYLLHRQRCAENNVRGARFFSKFCSNEYIKNHIYDDFSLWQAEVDLQQALSGSASQLTVDEYNSVIRLHCTATNGFLAPANGITIEYLTYASVHLRLAVLAHDNFQLSHEQIQTKIKMLNFLRVIYRNLLSCVSDLPVKEEYESRISSLYHRVNFYKSINQSASSASSSETTLASHATFFSPLQALASQSAAPANTAEASPATFKNS